MNFLDEVRDAYGLWRPSPLYRARRLERLLKTLARIYYKAPIMSLMVNEGMVEAIAYQKLDQRLAALLLSFMILPIAYAQGPERIETA